MTVSVIVPTYNSGHFIAEAIDSILGQTRVPDQIIIVDDGSTDDTEQVVRRYTDPRIEYIRQVNAGVSAARNAGLQAARGELVTFLDADDRWRPNFVERMCQLLTAHDRAVCAFSNFVRFEHATGEVTGDQFTHYPELRAATGVTQPWAFRTLVRLGEIPAFPVVMMYRRALIDDLRFDVNLRVCEDMHFALRAFMRGGVAWTSEVLCEVRRHGANVTRDVAGMAVHKLHALEALTSHITCEANMVAYRDRLVKAHIDAAVHQIRAGQVRGGVRDFWGGLRVPGSNMRKLKGSMRLALTFAGGAL